MALSPNCSVWTEGSGSNVYLVTKTASAARLALMSGQSEVATLTGDLTLVRGTNEPYQYLNPNGSTRIVKLYQTPAEGDIVFVMNIGTNAVDRISFQTYAGTVVDLLSINQKIEVQYAGGSWRVIRS